MPPDSVKILLTGLPGCGKTTAVMKIVAKHCTMRKIKGFYTQEIRKDGERKGFLWTTLDGDSGVLAHTDVKDGPKVGRYGVNVVEFEKGVVPILDAEQKDVDLFVVDEIGKMECLSGKFVAAMRRLFASEKSVLAAVAQKGTGFISEVKRFPCARLFNLTRQENDRVVGEILEILWAGS